VSKPVLFLAILLLSSCAQAPQPTAVPVAAAPVGSVAPPKAQPAPQREDDQGRRIAIAQGMKCFRTGGHVECRLGFFGSRLPGDKTTILEDVREIAAGEVHACAIKRSGELVCWGHNEDGELGDGTTQSRWQPRAVPDVPGAVKVAVGNRMTCAVFADDSVRCWGGMGGTPPRSRPQVVEGVKGKVRSISAGFFQGCVALEDGRVMCFGPSGKSGGAIKGLTDVVEVAVGSHVCARRSDGTVWCWGTNGNGQIGRPQGEDEDVPRPVSGLGRAKQIAAGPYFTCALLEAGDVSCWGSITEAEHVPTRMPELEELVEIGAGYDGVCGLTKAGKDACNKK
jgi:Regulator of chromosome condensation (RCC1) repeat